jgi:hypothetical protein
MICQSRASMKVITISGPSGVIDIAVTVEHDARGRQPGALMAVADERPSALALPVPLECRTHHRTWLLLR